MKRIMKLVSILFLGAMFSIALTSCDILGGRQYVEIYETTGTKSKLLSRQTDLEYKEVDELSMNVTVNIDYNKKFQDFLGLGASLTHSSAYLLMQLDSQKRAEVLEELYGSTGARFNFLRIPVGASDFVETQEFFTCNDLADSFAEDLALTQFSVKNDENIIGVLKEISKLNSNLKLIAVPWSAPAWMKTSHSLIGGDLEEKYNEVFVKYLIKFVQTYKNEGINFNYISLVNEPYITNVRYPSMQMNGNQAASIIKLLGNELSKAKLSNIKVMAYDHNYSSNSAIEAELYIDSVLGDKEAAKYVSGIAYHGYGNSGFDDFAGGLDYVSDYKKETYITEVTEHSGSVDFANNISYAMKNVLINPLNYNLSAAMYWNYTLSSDGKPVNGNNSVCFGLMNIDQESSGYYFSKNAAYYAMAHISKFAYPVKNKLPKRIFTESSNEDKIIVTAFLRGDNRIVVVVHNTNDATYEDVDFIVDSKSVTYRLMPQSIITLVL